MTHAERELSIAEAELEAARARVAYWQRRAKLAAEPEAVSVERASGPVLPTDEELRGVSDLTRMRARQQLTARLEKQGRAP